MPKLRFWLASLAVGLAACGTVPDDYDRRMRDTYAFIEQWERALKGEADDRGWSLLSGNARAGFDDEAQYVALAEAADWTSFELTPVGGFCDDLYACSIGVVVSPDPSSTPAFLLRSPNDADDSSYHLLVLVDEDEDGAADEPRADVGNGFVQVWWERVPWPAPGIGGGGG